MKDKIIKIFNNNLCYASTLYENIKYLDKFDFEKVAIEIENFYVSSQSQDLIKMLDKEIDKESFSFVYRQSLNYFKESLIKK